MAKPLELSLRPYNGRLFLVSTRKAYIDAQIKLFDSREELPLNCEGRFAGGKGKDGLWTYLIWADKPHTLAHELAHVVLHVFERCGIDPISGNGEPFCYMLSQLILESKLK